MYKKVEKILLIITDFVSILCAFFLWAKLRQEFGFFSESNYQALLTMALLFFAYWFLVYMFFGLYRPWYAQSRVDELINVFKTITFGVLVIFLATLDFKKDLSKPPTISRMFIINFWLIMLLSASVFRAAFRTIQRALLSAGIGARKTLIVGWGEKSWALLDKLVQFPALGYNVVGFVGAKNQMQPVSERYKGIPLLGHLENLNEVIGQVKAEEIIFSLEGTSKKRVMDLVNSCNGQPVNFKIIPELYEIVLGQVRTNQIYGVPLINILPQHMPPWERQIKRLMDIVISLIILVVFFPLWLLCAILIKLDSPGPIFYNQERVGKNGRLFNMHKFRSMVQDAESKSGPKWAEKQDPRITRMGRIIRKLRLDEVPQFYNVLRGEMSLIGPRPERPFFVEKFKKLIPFYARRLTVRPGITGWAQILGDYDTSIENVKTKLQYDLFYLENMSLRMDLKILLNTIYVMLRGRGQ